MVYGFPRNLETFSVGNVNDSGRNDRVIKIVNAPKNRWK